MLNFNSFGQNNISENQTNEIKREEFIQKKLIGNWQNYATNNVYIKSIIQQKYEIDQRINLLQKQRLQFIAEDHFNTYTNSPFLIVDDQGHNKVYASREVYDNEIISGLIKSSLAINNEIIRQKNLYFAANGSNNVASGSANFASPLGLKVTNN